MDMYNGHFNNRFIDLHYFGAFCVSTISTQNGRVESISTVSVITVLGRKLPTLIDILLVRLHLCAKF